jgi:hypothetical protein
MGIARAERAKQLEASHTRHRDVGHHDVDSSARNTSLCLERVGAKLNVELSVETTSVASKDDRIIIDEQHGHTCWWVGPIAHDAVGGQISPTDSLTRRRRGRPKQVGGRLRGMYVSCAPSLDTYT